MHHGFVKSFLSILLVFAFYKGYSQPGTTIELDKPKAYQNRTLTSEKTGTKKFKLTRHVFQNMITHYNYYFNANNRMNDLIDRAKLVNKDDYTQLLNFYGYSIDVTAKDKDMDSILYKCNAGILLHDLRNDWIDNMYLIMGKAYFYRKDFDSANHVFQYIAYAFSPREDPNYFTPVGSNSSNTNGVFSVSTDEKTNFIKKITTLPPSRNDALLWEARVYIEAGHYIEAAGMLQVLRSDPVFPQRLQKQLHETFAYWFYKQHMYDSAAANLSQAISIAGDAQAQARREFLTAQLYLLSRNDDEAIYWYDRAATHALDPVMEVYANLNSLTAYSGNSDSLLQKKISNLLKLAKKDRYIGYRDIIYYALAQMVMQKNDYATAKLYLHKSVTSSVNNPQQKSRSFMMLADVSYTTRDFIGANNYYDSVSASSLSNDDDKARLKLRVAALKTISQNLLAVRVEDSLQAIALLPKAQQDAIIKKILKQLRKQQGLKDEDNGADNINGAVRQTNAPDLFSNNNTGDWYFNNQTLKASGFNSFRQQWGNRPNVDNWRRQEAVQKAIAINQQKADARADSIARARGPVGADSSMTFNGLYKKLPTTPEKLKASNEKIIKAYYTVGETFENKLEDYPFALDYYDSVNLKFAGNSYEEQVLFNQYYCYTKLGKKMQADSVKTLLNSKYSKGKFNSILQKGAEPAVKPDADPATQKYDEIYNMFIKGDFERAKQEKTVADNMYGKSHWTPQLLFIEAIYYVSKHEDSAAINRLNNLAKLYPTSPMAEKAKTMADVLHRRREIERYLTNLQITRYKEDEAPMPVTTATNEVVKEHVAVKADTVVTKAAVPVTVKPVLDTVKPIVSENKTYAFVASDTQYVSILLDSVAPVFSNEAANAFNRFNASNNFMLHLKATQVKLDSRYNIVLIGPFVNATAALDYVDKTRPMTASRIIPWLTADKYTYSMISNANLAVLQQTKDLAGYKALLQKVLPGKF